MSIIEEIKQSIPHEYGCHAERRYHDAIEYQKALNAGVSHECNCSRRRKIAWLEKIEEPTAAMYIAFRSGDSFDDGIRKALKAAEEMRDLYREYFDARSMPTPERRAQIVDRIREIVGGGE